MHGGLQPSSSPLASAGFRSVPPPSWRQCGDGGAYRLRLEGLMPDMRGAGTPDELPVHLCIVELMDAAARRPEPSTLCTYFGDFQTSRSECLLAR